MALARPWIATERLLCCVSFTDMCVYRGGRSLMRNSGYTVIYNGLGYNGMKVQQLGVPMVHIDR